MKIVTHKIIIAVLFSILLSCSEDDTLSPVVVETNPDIVTISQNSVTDIFVLQNDINLPASGQLTVTAATKGLLTVNTNTSNFTNSTVTYTANPNEVGTDSFEYTICDATGNNCKTETVSITITTLSTVNFFNGDTPFDTLSEFNFFDGNLKEMNPNFGVIPYDVISPLFSDYAHKKRFVWMPNGVKATYLNDYSILDFPVGTVLIKSFFYDNVLPNNSTKILETRLMYKKVDGWEFAKYVWNDEQTEAYLSNQGSVVNLSWVENGNTKTVNYRIPSRAECFTCHNQSDVPNPIGVKPQNLNKTFNYADGTANQLSKLVEIGYLNTTSNNIVTTIAWGDTTQPLNERVRSYLDINCAHCHSDLGYCNYRPIRFAYNETNASENMGVCVEPETQFIPNSQIVKPNNTDLSILHYRMNTVDEDFRMPILGRTLRHEEGVRLVQEWINSLTNCD